MPELSLFFDIVITTYARDHRPAHFHARYGDNEALIEIETSQLLRGQLPRRALAMVEEWCDLHRPELQAAWDSLRRGTSLDQIAPLE